MLNAIHPKLPMRNKTATKEYYISGLGFEQLGDTEYTEYLMLKKDRVEIHFFRFKDLKPKKNYGQVYIRTNEIDRLYKEFIANGIAIHPNGALEMKPWGQREFSLLDPDSNLLTFGQAQ